MSSNNFLSGARTLSRYTRVGRSVVSDITRKKPLFTSGKRLLGVVGCDSIGAQRRFKSNGNGDKDLSSLIHPVPVKPCNDPDGINVGAELTGALKKEDLLKTINKFYRREEVKQLAAENGLDNKLFHEAYVSFRRFCIESEALPVDLHIVFSDILQEAGHVNDIFPYFLDHAKLIFPHLDCMEDLQKISDLRLPANWYPEARAMQRKIIYHAGPTNSGKTYHALERFLSAKSGVYCGPLRLLANEVFTKANLAGTPCDLITGEERRYVQADNEPSNHVACTVEMTMVNAPYEVAVIDEIQMLRDASRGWAWTRALLGVCAEEVHLCGEASATDIVREFAQTVGDEFEVRRYKRLTPLSVLDKAIENFDNIRPGDCIVCFSKNDVYHCSRQLEKRGRQVAVIYGGLPPGTKVAQAQKFNDPDDPCKVMVSTDAIGMGINLNIKRIIFYSLVKPTVNENGEKEIDVIPPSQALQIAGRAGRYGTTWEDGEVTTFKASDVQQLRKLLSSTIEPIEQAGLHPTAEQIELFAYHLPKATLCNLIDIFVTLSQLDNDRYFMCNVEDFKFLADMIEHVPLPLRTRYVFCCAPIPKKQPFVCTMFLKFTRRFSRGEPLTLDWLCRQLGWPFSAPINLQDLIHLEGVFDVLDLYLWLSYRFPDMLVDAEHVRDMQKELDALIQVGVIHLTNLLKNSENAVSNKDPDDDDGFQVASRSERANRSARRQHGIPHLDEDGQLIDPHKAQQPKKGMESLRARFERAKLDHNPTTAEIPSLHRESLTSQLVNRGLLTPAMVQQLQRELTGGNGNEPFSPKRGSKSSKPKKKK